MSPILYTRSGPVPVGQDPKTYDLGIFQMFAQGSTLTTAGQIGELYVSYKVCLRKPKIFTALGYSIPQDVFEPLTVSTVVGKPVNSSYTVGGNFAATAALVSGNQYTLTFANPTVVPVIGQVIIPVTLLQSTGFGIICNVTVVTTTYTVTVYWQGNPSPPTASTVWYYNTYNPKVLTYSNTAGTGSNSLFPLITNSIGGSISYSADIIQLTSSSGAALPYTPFRLTYTFPVALTVGAFRVTLTSSQAGGAYAYRTDPTITCSVGCQLTSDIISSTSVDGNGFYTNVFIADIAVTAPGVTSASFYVTLPLVVSNGGAATIAESIHCAILSQ